MASRRPADYAVRKRRQEESRRAGMESLQKERQAVGFMASWEIRTQERIEQNKIRDRFGQLKREAARKLEERRGRLSRLLSEEQAQFEREVQDSFETAAQRRERLANRARELKAAREKKRQELAEQLRYRQFRETNDSIRSKDSSDLVMKAARERQAQLRERIGIREANRQQEEQWAKEWDANRQLKIKREKEEEEFRRAKNLEMRRVLDLQTQEAAQRRFMDKATEEEEARKQQEEWDHSERQRQREEEASNVRKAAARAQVLRENQERMALRGRQSEQDRLNEKRLLQRQLEKERVQAEAEAAERERVTSAARQYQEHLRRQMVKEAEDESYLERLRQAEMEQVWKKREDQWAAEDRARKALMAEVDETRQAQLAAKAAAAEEERRLDREYSAQQSAVARARQAKEDEEAAERAAQASANAAEVRLQAEEKARRLARDKQEAFLEQRAAAAAEAQYADKVAELHAAGLPSRSYARKSTKWYT